MRPGANLALQVAALAAAVLRLRWGGFETVLFMFTVIGPVLALVPFMLALALLGHRVLTWQVWVPFVGTAAGTVLASLFLGVSDEYGLTSIPVLRLLGMPDRPSEWVGLTEPIGMAGIYSFPVFLVWAVIASTKRAPQALSR